jgi:hypothetical protein
MDERAAKKLWVEQWQKAGPVLERIRHEELRAMTDDEAARAFEALAELACEVHSPSPRLTSGFVEQQRLFQKLMTNGSPN